MPRPSSPLNAKASVRSPYALDRSQQNSCVGVSLRTGLRSNRSTPTHALWYLSLPDNDVFSRSTLKAWGGRVDPSFTMSNQLSADALQLEFCCFHSIARGWPAEPELAAAEPAFAQWASAWRRPSSLRRAKAGGARRDRTDDLMLAKHALSQLSYGPVKGQSGFASRQSDHIDAHRLLPTAQFWWAWEDSNFRPHAYQARALTN